ncbi:hypothetical protein BJ741DRAFT_637249, partial [Chytriomyces cf. hyalinus JEL632]
MNNACFVGIMYLLLRRKRLHREGLYLQLMLLHGNLSKKRTKVIRGGCFWETDLQQSDKIFNWLCCQLNVYLAKDPAGRSQPLPPSKQVAIALYRLASGASYIVVGSVFGLAESTVMIDT